MDMTLQEMLSVVEVEFLREVWCAVGFVMLHLIAFASLVAMCHAVGAFSSVARAFRNHPISASVASLIASPFIIYGAVKVCVLGREQCDYKIGSEVDITDGSVGYYRFVGTEVPTNIGIACCGGLVTNIFTFTQTGQFYFETSQYQSLDLIQNPMWVRDSETNDWIRAVADIYGSEVTGSSWVRGWSAEIAHLPDYGNPKDYRYWFIGSEANLPEKVIEGGVDISIDRYYRDAHHIVVEFHTDDPELADSTFVLQVRFVSIIDGVEVLGDWQTLDTTKTRKFDVRGNFVQAYNRIRIYVDKGVE